jgi:hypothetical protein
MKHILDRNFRYTNSVSTDLRETFARVRREISQLERAQPTARVDVARRPISKGLKLVRDPHGRYVNAMKN